MKKHFLGILLSLLLVLTMMPATVLADEQVDTAIYLYKEYDGEMEVWWPYIFDNYSDGCGETMGLAMKSGVTYYLALLGNEEGVTGKCNIEIKGDTIKDIVDMEEAFKALDETTSLPYSSTYELGSEPVYYLSNIFFAYGKLVKIEEEKAASLNVKFYGQDEDVNTSVIVLKENGDGLEFIWKYDNNNYNGMGEEVTFSIPADTCYYFAFTGTDYRTTGNCRIEINNEMEGENLYYLTQGFENVTELTSLPVKFQYELGSENLLYTTGDEGGYGKLITVEVTEPGTGLDLEFYGADEDIDTSICVVKKENDGYVIQQAYYSNNYNGCGESALFVAGEPGIYGIALYQF